MIYRDPEKTHRGKKGETAKLLADKSFSGALLFQARAVLASCRRTSSRVSRRPLIDHPCPLPKRQSDTRPMLDRVLEYRAGPAEAVAGIEQAVDLRFVPCPLLDLVEVAIVGIDRAVRFLMEGYVVRLRFFGHRKSIALPHGAHGSGRRPSASIGTVAAGLRPSRSADQLTARPPLNELDGLGLEVEAAAALNEMAEARPR
jgi:hypothetical protein